MNIKKIRLGELYRCYSTMAMNLDNELHVFFASEEKGYPCMAYHGKDFSESKVVWEKGGGTMSMIPIPHTSNQFLAVNDFYLKETPSHAGISWVTYNASTGFVRKDILKLPFLHRFDIYEVGQDLYLIGATIAHNKADKEDWSQAGKIYVGKLPKDLNHPITLEVIAEGLFRNHGYSRSPKNDGGYFTCDQGVVKVTIPGKDGKWHVDQVLDGPIGEIALCDVDGDGHDELLTIEPFHGNTIKLYKLINGKYEVVYVYPHKIDFAHTLVGTTLRGKPAFVGGIRREEADLFSITWENGKWVTTIIDQGVGPANLNVAHFEDHDLIHSSNHTANEAAVYVITD
jgi:hypothetical protein